MNIPRMVQYDQDIHHRKSIRLKGYDYSELGCCFITVCAQNRIPLFGMIQDGEMILNDAGKIQEDEWCKATTLRPNVIVENWVVMPNHFHGIVIINYKVESKEGVCNTPLRSPSQTIGVIIRGFKSAATKRINNLRGGKNLVVWQRNYYEHIIRNEKSFLEVSHYIKNNPANWQTDLLFVT